MSGTPVGASTDYGAQSAFYGYHGGGEAWGMAPRLHGGLAADEFPAILQRGESVTPKGGLQSTINIINQSGQQLKGKVSGAKFDGRKYVTSILIEDLNSNGPLAQAMGR
jgi:hypothetical protein